MTVSDIDDGDTSHEKETIRNSIRALEDRCDLHPHFRKKLRSSGATQHSGNQCIHSIKCLDESFLHSIKSMCLDKGLQLKNVLQYVWHITLSVYGTSTTTAIAYIDEDQTINSEYLIIPVIVDHSETKSASFFIKEIEKNINLTIANNQFLSNKPATLDLFDSVFASSGVAIDKIRSKIKFTYKITDKLELDIVYDESVFDNEFSHEVLETIVMLLEQVNIQPSVSYPQLEYVSEINQKRINKWNNTEGLYPKGKRLNELFEESVRDTPENIAVINGENTLTYRLLNEMANQFAHYLKCSLKVKNGELVALLLDKCELTIVAILGIWKACAACVAIDPAYPDERIKFSLKDTKSKTIITHQCYEQRIKNFHFQHLEIIPIEFMNLSNKNHSSNDPTTVEVSNHLAYISYTSGTTGEPKGVLKYHKSLVNSITDIAKKYGIGKIPERIVLYSSYVFEPFYRQMLLALLNCHTLIIVADEVKLNIQRFSKFLEDQQITYLNGTASILQEYDYSRCPHLSRLVLVGEELTKIRYLKLRDRFKKIIISEYGFTESAFVTLFKIFPCDSSREDSSVGKPLRNVKCYVLNEHYKQVPIGAIGELYVGGAGVSSGYLNRSKLTNERFLENPYQTESERMQGVNCMMYKTGDLMRWLCNGELEFYGRNDFQIKLRGIRIEPGEIESTLSTHPDVETCVVKVRDSVKYGDARSKSLIAYFVSNSSSTIREHVLREYLENKLPRYMVPNRIIQVNKIPWTINGKVDLMLLPDICLHSEQNDVILSRNELDSQLCQIWSEILHIPLDLISINDDFFMLGGNSITSILLVNKIRQYMHYNCTVECIFNQKTISRISDCLVKMENKTPINYEDFHCHQVVDLISNKQKIEICFEANSLQQGMMFHYLKYSDDAYIMQALLRYDAKIDLHNFKLAWEYAQKRFSSLRLRFFSNEKVYQVIDNHQDLDWRYMELSTEKSLDKLLDDDRREAYDLNFGQLFRIYCIKNNDLFYTVLFSCHHIIIDGWSLQKLYEYVNETYLMLSQGKDIIFAKETCYIEAQSYLQMHKKAKLKYWKNEVDTITERCDLDGFIKEKHRNKVALRKYDHISTQKDRIFKTSCSSSLNEFCSENGVTLNSVLQFAWHQLLRIYGNGTHTVVGTTVSGRSLPIDGIEESIGMFINTLPLIIDHLEQDEKDILSAIKYLQKKVTSMNDNANVDLGQLQTGEEKHGLFDSLFVVEIYPKLDETIKKKHETLLGFNHIFDYDKINYPLSVIIKESDEKEVCIKLVFASELFDDTTINDIVELLDYLLKNIIENANLKVSELNYISPKVERKLQSFNKTEKVFPTEKTLHKLFEEEVERVPTKTALVFDKTRITYEDLNMKCNRLSYSIQRLVNLKPGDLVAIFMEKSELLIIAILAIWKAGGAYVPLDTGYPTDRIKYILEDTNAKLVITTSSYNAILNSLDEMENVRLLLMEEHLQRKISLPSTNPITDVTSNDLAYVIYTSGSTGRPKGVMVEHKGVVNLKYSLEGLFSLKKKENEVFLSFSNYVFDHSVEQMTDALLNGQTLIVLNEQHRYDPARLYSCINDNKVTYLSGTPSVICEYDFSGFKYLSTIDVVGEDLTHSMFQKIRKTFKGLIINGYGPTEVSITTHKRLYFGDEDRTNKSIGLQIANSKCYVLNRTRKRVPPGAVGEMFLGGVGVARGYINRDDLTEKAFIPNPFQSEEEKHKGINARIYATGDLVRWMENGEIEFLGRNDQQVKVRGLRIELNEIESALASHSEVKTCAVITKSYKHTFESPLVVYIIGFCVLNNDVTELSLKEYIQKTLPQYMIPNKIIKMQHLPVTSSGKLNYKKLGEIYETDIQYECVPPSSEIQVKLCNIWSQLLGIDSRNIGVNENFFNLGGDSFMIMREVAMIKDVMGVTLSVPIIFSNQTIETLSMSILNKASDDECKENRNSVVPQISFEQERLIFIDQLEGGTNAYNIPLIYQLSKSEDLKAIKNSVLAVILKHEVLRTVYPNRLENGHHQPQIMNKEETIAMFNIDTFVVKNTDELINAFKNDSKYLFKIDTEIPLKAIVYKSNNHNYLVVIVHHIAFDAWSNDIFLRDLNEFYSYFIKNGKPLQTSLSHQYANYVSWQRNQLTPIRLKILLEYWKQDLRNFEELNLKTDYPRPSQFDYSGEEFEFNVDNKTTMDLQGLAMSLNISLNNLLTSGFILLLSRYSNQNDIMIGSPVTSRNLPEYNNTIGYFVNLMVLRVILKSTNTVADYISSVNRKINNAIIHQDIPFEKLLKELGVFRDQSKHSLIQVIFTSNTSETKQKNSKPQTREGIHQFEPNFIYPIAKFDISTKVVMDDGSLRGSIIYAKKLFNRKTISSMAKCYICILSQFSQMQNGKMLRSLKDIRGVSYRPDDEFFHPAKVRSRFFSGTNGDFANETLHKIFENYAELSPNAIAISQRHGDGDVSYRQLNERANKLASYIKSIAEIKPDNLLALVLEKSELVLICILAVWKAGGAYVPIDPNHPIERIKFILDDSNAKIVLSESVHNSKLEKINLPIITIDHDKTIELIQLESVENHQPISCRENLAYVIYTSGTTGTPKGVLVEHKSVVSFRESLKGKYFDINAEREKESILFLSNYVFDFSVEQIVLSILFGNKLIIPDQNLQINEEFYEYLNEKNLTFLSGTPTFLLQIDLAIIQKLKILVVAGEVFTHLHFKKFREKYRGLIVQAYGTTETTVYNTIKYYENDTEFKNSLGKCLPNTEVLVLDKDMQLLPQGAVGELCLTGACLSRGYMNCDEENKKSFIDGFCYSDVSDPLRIYKTGDLVRYSCENELQYMGRNDSQVNIHGLRVEIGEIETLVSQYPGVEQCVIVGTNDESNAFNYRGLSCYVVCDSKDINKEELGLYLEKKIPQYMLPTKYIFMKDSLPVTVNGKLDIKALLLCQAPVKNHVVLPKNEMENKMCVIWQDILNNEDIDVEDDFFNSGGDSILSMQVVADIRQFMNLNISVKDIFVFRNVRNIIKNVTKIYVNTNSPVMKKIVFNKEIELLPIQQWFFQNSITDVNNFNQYFYVKTPQLDLPKLKKSLNELIRHHDAFRLRFRKNKNNEYVQYYIPESSDVVELTVINMQKNSQSQMDKNLCESQKCFNIENGPMFSVAYIYGDEDNSAQIRFIIHHLIVDSVSWRILTRDLKVLYGEGKLKRSKETSYSEWVTCLKSRPQTESEIAYWRDIMKMNMNFKLFSKEAYNISEFSLEKLSSQHLLNKSNVAYQTKPRDLMLTSMGYALKKISGSCTNFVTLEGHGREDVFSSIDITNTMGWFTTMYPLKIITTDEIETNIKFITEEMGYMPNNGLDFGLLYGYKNDVLPTVSFNYLGQFHHEGSKLESWSIVEGGLTKSSCTVNCNTDIDVTVTCYQGIIRFHISSRIGDEQLNEFTTELRKCLLEIIDYTSRIEKIQKKKITSRGINGTSADFFEPYILFDNDPKKNDRLFVLPPGEGGAESYLNNIVPKLSSHNLVLFNNIYIHEGNTKSTFEEIAHFYITHIKALQPFGPYNFFGWSFGGVLAMEISMQMLNAGECINSLMMVDSFFNVRKPCSELGLDNNVLDVINWMYQPEKKVLEQLALKVNNITLFKTEGIQRSCNTEKDKLMNYYVKSTHNELDTYISQEKINLIYLQDSHYTWVGNEKDVKRVCDNVLSKIS